MDRDRGGWPDVRALVFDVNGTLVDIRTEDDDADVFRAAAHYLTYQGIHRPGAELRELYARLVAAQLRDGPERYPEFDVVAVWRAVVDRLATDYTRALPASKRGQLPLALAELTRAVARRRLRLHPHVRDVLDRVRGRFPLAVVTDGQSAWARAELHQVGLLGLFDPVVVSGDHGFRKPDPRLFRAALTALGVAPAQAVYVGDDMYRDVHGAREVGMRTVRYAPGPGAPSYRDVVPDATVTDHRQLLALLGAGDVGGGGP